MNTIVSPFFAAAYIRVSTEEQAEYSPDSQLKRILEYAASHQLSIPPEYIFIDEGISGRSADNRPAFLRMIRTAKQKPRPFDRILVWKFSRFARNRQDSILYKSMLRKECGIDVISITEQLSQDPTSILIEALLEAMDEYYSLNLAQEVRRGMNEKFSRGGVVTSPPFGYRMGTASYEPDPARAAAVRMIFRDFLNGRTIRDITEKLNAMQILTARGHTFEPRTVRYILGNPAYIGKQRRRLFPGAGSEQMTIVDALHPPLISEQDFMEVQKRLLNLQKRYGKPAGSSGSSFLLQGLVRCSCCRATLTRSGKESLQCCRYTRGQCPESHSISIPLLYECIQKKLEQDLALLPQLSRLMDYLKSSVPSESDKNACLKSFISHILFFRRTGAIQIFYYV